MAPSASLISCHVSASLDRIRALSPALAPATALTGRTTSPGIFEVLAVLGREECLGRLADQAATQ